MQGVERRRHRMARRSHRGARQALRVRLFLVFDEDFGMPCRVFSAASKHYNFSPLLHIGEMRDIAGDGIRGIPKNKEAHPGHSTKRVFAFCMRRETRCAAQPPREVPPNCQYAERLSGMAATSCICDRALGCTRREGQGPGPHGRSGRLGRPTHMRPRYVIACYLRIAYWSLAVTGRRAPLTASVHLGSHAGRLILGRLRQDMVMTTTLLRLALRLEKIGGGYEGMARRSNGMDVLSVGRLLPAGRRAQLALAQAGWVQWQPWEGLC